MTIWLTHNWLHVIIPLLAFIAVVFLGFLIRRMIHKALNSHKQTLLGNVLSEYLWRPFLLWFILLGIYAAIGVSIFSQVIKKFTGEGLESVFVFSLMWTLVIISEQLGRYYLGKTKAIKSLLPVILNITKTVIIVVGLLVILEIWGVSTLPVIIALGAFILIAEIAFRNTFGDLLAGFEIFYSDHIKVGHLIKLESGDIGHIVQISWTRTTIRTDQGNSIIIPNARLMANAIVNYGAVETPSPTAGSDKDKEGVSVHLVGKLTERENEVLRLIGYGATNREIGEKLFISEHTVKSHLRSILSKLNLSNRQQAAAYAQKEGLIEKIDLK